MAAKLYHTSSYGQRVIGYYPTTYNFAPTTPEGGGVPSMVSYGTLKFAHPNNLNTKHGFSETHSLTQNLAGESQVKGILFKHDYQDNYVSV